MRSSTARSAQAALFLTLAAACCTAQLNDPFTVSGTLTAGTNPPARLRVTIRVPDEHYLYSDSVSIEAPEYELTAIHTPRARERQDPFLEKTVMAYEQDARFVYELGTVPDQPVEVNVTYQGCSDTICFRPVTKTLDLKPSHSTETAGEAASTPSGKEMEDQRGPRQAATAEATNGWKRLTGRFDIAARASGYMKPEAFTSFLESARRGEEQPRAGWGATVEEKGWLVAFVLIILGGLALNLTPCVLPMMPINLAIIGAGAQAANRRRGFMLGAAYGIGMALAYGGLGLLVILTGSRFGALNASPWFNAAIALLFVVLALAVMGIIPVDFSRLQSKAENVGKQKGNVPVALFFGGIMALLAGACVAPVVISVLLFATDLFAAGNQWALLLPFLLGIGMALPWPFAGAGLSFLPKPGRWMLVVKYGFGLIVLGFAIYYGRLAVDLFLSRRPEAKASVAEAQQKRVEEGDWLDTLPTALTRAAQQEKPLLIDFWATWCKSCLKMDETTFSDPAVRKALDDFVKVKFQAEDLGDPDIEEVLDHFEVLGLPTYVILTPREASQE